MDKGHVALASACVVAVVVTAHALVAGSQWEQRVRGAEAQVAVLQQGVDSLRTVAVIAESVAAHVDTVRVTLTKLIVHTDSVSRPDSTCGPSLAARDTVIAAGAAEVDDLQHVVRAQIQALTKLTAEKDTLTAVLNARPKAAVALEFLHPSLHLSLQAMVYPQQRVGIGLSFDLARWRL